MTSARYQIQSTVRRGPLGAVHRAWDEVAGCWVALREKHAATLEAEALLALKGVAGVPELVLEEQNQVAVRWVQGLNLEELMAQGSDGRLQALRCVPSLLQLLQEVHGRGWLHGDVAASNVMLAAEPERVWLIDWACARRLAMQDGGDAPGTIFYMAPELFDAAALTVASELYAVGVLFYECVAGELPFLGESRLQVITSHHRHDCVPLVDEQMLWWFEKMTARRPEARFVSAAEALSHWQAGWAVS